MEKVQLLTMRRKEVALLEIPEFTRGYEPRVILWGNRFFKREGVAQGVAIYVEVFGYVASYIHLPEGQSDG